MHVSSVLRAPATGEKEEHPPLRPSGGLLLVGFVADRPNLSCMFSSCMSMRVSDI